MAPMPHQKQWDVRSILFFRAHVSPIPALDTESEYVFLLGPLDKVNRATIDQWNDDLTCS